MAVDWKKELADLQDAAKTQSDKDATAAFAKAIGPYLDNPEMLRTLLSKIQRRAPEAFTMVVTKPGFNNLDDLKKELPDNVSVHDL